MFNLMHVVFFLMSLGFWSLYRKYVPWIATGYSELYYANLVSLTHALCATTIGVYLLVTNSVTLDVIAYPHLFSMSYFIYDTFQILNEPIYAVHHVCSVMMLGMTYWLQNEDYYQFANLLMILAENTAIFQNYYFLKKCQYGVERKVEFNQEYLGLFEFYSNLFTICRLVLIPMVLIVFLLIIEEMLYFWLIGILSSLIIVGSLYWLYGQRRMIARIKYTFSQNTNVSHASQD